MLERLKTCGVGARPSAASHAPFQGPIDIRLLSESIPLRGFAPLLHDLPLQGRVQLDLPGSETFENPRLRGLLQRIDVQSGLMNIGSGPVVLALGGRQMTFSTAGLQAFSLDKLMSLDSTPSARICIGVRPLALGLAAVQLGGASKGAIEGELSGTIEVKGQLRSSHR
jgi:hypothetical protein